MMVSTEEKRWIVVGIAMNKVVAAVLRDYIKQGMDTHYTNNTYCHGLTTPCTLKTLTYRHVSADPNLRRLKFQNINNNLHNYGNHKAHYNYNINSSVDLAKLFLPDYLAAFSAFDESLDMSAILRLLGFNNPAPIFPSPNPLISIQKSADDVRENIRNRWGHSNFNEWSEVLSNDCFSKLETLVRSLGLTSGAEKNTLDQLSEWQTKGFQLCMGNVVDENLKEAKGPGVRFLAVGKNLQEEKKTWKEEIDVSIERLVSTGKIPSEDLVRIVQGLEEDTANAMTELDKKQEQVQDSRAKTDDQIKQLEHEINSQMTKDEHIPVPNEIKARGPDAKIAFENALRIGKVKVYRARVMLIGPDRAGKTSLKKSLLGMPFNPEELSTVGIEVDPSTFEIDTDQVKNWRHTEEKLGLSQFAPELAKMAARELENKEAQMELRAQEVTKEKRSHVLFNDGQDKTSQKDSISFPSSNEVEEAGADHVDGKSENAAKVPHLKIDPTLPPEEFTQCLIQHLKGLNLHTDTTSTEPVVNVDLWDFAGQHLYYASHSVFLSPRAVYLLVCNLSKGLYDTAQPCVRQRIHGTLKLENPNGQTNMDDLLSWLVSVNAVCLSKQLLAEGKLSYIRPPVIIVGTHADKPVQNIKEMQSQIDREISEKDYAKHVIPGVICIDNTQSSTDAGVNELKEKIMEVLRQEPYMGEEVPVRWFNFEKVVKALVAEERHYLNRKQLQAIVQEVCFIESEKEVDIMLDFYHDLGLIVKHGTTVVLQAQWLINVFKQLITIPCYKDMEPKHVKNWKRLEREGVLCMELVRHIFSKFTQREGSVTENDILGMMERFGLIAEFATSSTDSSYFVPAQLSSPTPEDLGEEEPPSWDPCPLYLDFLSGYVPHGFFSQLVSRCIRWCSDSKFEELPLLFLGAAKFFIGKPVSHNLTFLCKRRFIKIVVNQMESDDREVSMAGEDDVCSLVRKFLEDTLKVMKLNLPWLSNLEYRLSVACPLCPERMCIIHDQVSCTHEDCFCLLEMAPPGKQMFCRKSRKPFMVSQLGKWFFSKNRTQDLFVHTTESGPPHAYPMKSDTALKVTLLASEWCSSMGGLSTINRQLATCLAKHKQLEVSLLVPQFACSEEEKSAARNHNVAIREAEKRPGYDPLNWLSFPPKDLAMDIVIGHGGKLGKQAQVIRESHNCKWVQVVHTAPEELGMEKRYADKDVSAISKAEDKHRDEVDLCKMADLVAAVGPKLTGTYSSCLRSCQEKQVIQLTPGIFSEFSDVKQAANEGDKFKVLIFGRGDPEDFSLKGYDIAAKAVVELKDSSYHLICVGATDKKQDEVAEKLRQHSRIPNRQLTVRKFVESKQRLKELFCEADLAIMPSRTEGFGLTALEALSAGLPILVSGNSGFGDALRTIIVPSGESFVVDSEEPKEWAKAIADVRQKGRAERLQEIQRLRTSYDEKFNWEEQCDVLVKKMWSVVRGTQG